MENHIVSDTPSCEESIPNPNTPHAFYLDVNWSEHKDHIIFLLEQYFDKYVVGFETTKDKVPHIHVLAETIPSQYQAFIAQAKRLYDLRGRATKGTRKQYGKVKIIKNLDNMVSYTIKSGNFHYRGYDQDYIQYRLDNSYEKNTLKDKFQKIVEELTPHAHLYSARVSEDLNYITDERTSLVSHIIDMHHKEYKTILGTPMLKRYLYALGLYTTTDIAKSIGNFWINEHLFNL